MSEQPSFDEEFSKQVKKVNFSKVSIDTLVNDHGIDYETIMAELNKPIGERNNTQLLKSWDTIRSNLAKEKL